MNIPLTPVLLQTQATVDSLSRHVNLLKLMQPAIMRNDRLHEASHSWWSKQRTIGKWVREDEGVRRVAGKLIGANDKAEMSAKEGEEVLLQKVRSSLNELWKGAQVRPV